MPSILTKDVSVTLLREVSRSFYLSLRFLPDEVRDQFSLGYLAARASDTVADNDSHDPSQRIAALEVLSAHFAPPWQLPADWGLSQAEGVDHPGEKRLIRELPSILANAARLNQKAQTALQNVLQQIVTGQKEDLEKAASGHPFFMPDAASLDRYTFLVAGSVGEFWTQSAIDTLGTRYLADETKNEIQLEEGIRLGKALQLVNILRDVGPDHRSGRCYLPESEIAAAGGWPAGEQEQMMLGKKLALPWFDVAADHLRAGRRHLTRIRNARLRFATALPLLFGWETLLLLKKSSPEVWWKGVKIPRSLVKRLLIGCLGRVWSPALLDRWLQTFEHRWV